MASDDGLKPPPVPASGYDTSMRTNKGLAPRTFEVIERERARTAGQELLGAFDEAQRVQRRTAAEAMRQGIRGAPAGTGVRTAQARQATQEAAAPQAKLLLQRAQAKRELGEERRSLGDPLGRDDIMAGVMAIDEHIAWMIDAGWTGDARKKALMARANAPGVHPYTRQYILYRLGLAPPPTMAA